MPKFENTKTFINNKSNPINTNIILLKTKRRKKSNKIIRSEHSNRNNELYNQNATKLPKQLTYCWVQCMWCAFVRDNNFLCV